MIAKDLMSSNLVVVPPEMPVPAIAELLAARGISAVPVVEADGTPLGIVTEGDLIRRLAEQPRGPLRWFFDLFRSTRPLIEQYRRAHGRTARDVMTKPLHAVAETANAEAIAGLMEAHQIRRVPVLRDGKLVGMVSRADLLRAILRGADAPTDGKVRTATGAPDDGVVLRRVIAAMREQPWVDTFWVYPHVADGVVILHGYARSKAMREGLRVLATGVRGVRRVDDQMVDMPLILRAMA